MAIKRRKIDPPRRRPVIELPQPKRADGTQRKKKKKTAR